MINSEKQQKVFKENKDLIVKSQINKYFKLLDTFYNELYDQFTKLSSVYGTIELYSENCRLYDPEYYGEYFPYNCIAELKDGQKIYFNPLGFTQKNCLAKFEIYLNEPENKLGYLFYSNLLYNEFDNLVTKDSINKLNSLQLKEEEKNLFSKNDKILINVTKFEYNWLFSEEDNLRVVKIFDLSQINNIVKKCLEKN